ncbi:MAG: integrase [Pseudomonas sp.]|uniref:integrase n=1 Tax=Pseudomonas sp. TaxID=306 RepID=UPI002718F7A0|nr:integrase [Pseudomonas sp.]MDO9332161.1 integrase [Pseudomonas sp.]
MSQLTGLTPGYEFLNDFGISEALPYTLAPWLLNDFCENRWLVKTIQQTPYTLDWSVRLADGSLLTDTQHCQLLRSLKHLLIISTTGINGEFTTLGLRSMQVRLAHSKKIIDYILINAGSYDLIQYGLAGINGDDLKAILNKLASSPFAEETVYAWRARVSNFCIQEMNRISDLDVQEIHARYPSMLEVSDEAPEKFMLSFGTSDIPRARAALMKAGLYYGGNHQGYFLNTRALSDMLYPDTLWGGQSSKSPLQILNFYPNAPTYRKEYDPVSVTTTNLTALQKSRYFYYRYALLSTAALSTLGLPTPIELDSIADYLPELKTPSRFKSVPSTNLLRLFRSSIEFHLQYGRKLLNCFIRIASFCKTQKIGMTQLSNSAFIDIIGPELANLGIKKLGIASNRRIKSGKSRKGSRKDYYNNLRANHGLLELICVYFGSAQLVIGMIMARRVDELVSLNASTCLDASKSWLIFGLAKSTRKAFGMRQRESRPIDAIAVEMITELQRFQKLLKRLKVIDDLSDLFSSPSVLGTIFFQGCSLYNYNRHLDFACDYFESDLNEHGERYYVRQHQLRRFFAIMFFYTNSFGELDTLRWMLGHRDVEHVWHYLTESLDAKEIRGAGVRYFAELAKKDRLENYKNLQQLLAERFGTTTFKLVDEQQIEDYLSALVEEGKARIEPHFFNDENGKSLKVLFIIS